MSHMPELLHRAGELQWLATDAGHLILLPTHMRPAWSGIEPPKDGRVVNASFRWNNPTDPASDYDRACDIKDYVGILDVGSSRGIVLAADPLPATAVPRADGGLLIARLYTSEVGLPDKLPGLPDTLAWTTVGDVIYHEPELTLFDSTEPGDEEPTFPSLAMRVVPGTYAIEHSQFENSDMHLWLVRLRRH